MDQQAIGKGIVQLNLCVGDSANKLKTAEISAFQGSLINRPKKNSVEKQTA